MDTAIGFVVSVALGKASKIIKIGSMGAELGDLVGGTRIFVLRIEPRVFKLDACLSLPEVRVPVFTLLTAVNVVSTNSDSNHNRH